MEPLQTDFSPVEKVGFERPPVGVKFDFFKPENINLISEPAAMCEMIRIAQNSDAPFYMDKESEDCFGRGAMGMLGKDGPAWANAGLIGPIFGVFKDPAANIKCMSHYTDVPAGAINYVSFASLPNLTFEPDLLIFTGTMKQCGAILRAMSYSTGEMFESKATPVFQCSWMFAYPYMTGKVNYIPMGAGFGTTSREVYEPGEVMVIVPSPGFNEIMANLKEMEITPPAWQMGREKWLPKKLEIYAELAKKAESEA